MAAVGGLTPQIVDALVAHTLVEECLGGTTLDGGEVAPHFLKGGTHHVLAVCLPGEEAVCEDVKFAMVQSEQLVKIALVCHFLVLCETKVTKNKKKQEKRE